MGIAVGTKYHASSVEKWGFAVVMDNFEHISETKNCTFLKMDNVSIIIIMFIYCPSIHVFTFSKAHIGEINTYLLQGRKTKFK